MDIAHHNTELQKNIGREKKLLQILPKIRYPTEDIMCDCACGDRESEREREREREKESENVSYISYVPNFPLKFLNVCFDWKILFKTLATLGLLIARDTVLWRLFQIEAWN